MIRLTCVHSVCKMFPELFDFALQLSNARSEFFDLLFGRGNPTLGARFYVSLA